MVDARRFYSSAWIDYEFEAKQILTFQVFLWNKRGEAVDSISTQSTCIFKQPTNGSDFSAALMLSPTSSTWSRKSDKTTSTTYQKMTHGNHQTNQQTNHHWNFTLTGPSCVSGRLESECDLWARAGRRKGKREAIHDVWSTALRPHSGSERLGLRCA